MKRLILSILLLAAGSGLFAQQTFEWGIRAGGTGNDMANDITSLENNTYITGKFSGTFDAGTKDIQSRGRDDAFFMRLDRNGKTDWIRTLGGQGTDEGVCLAYSGDHIFMAGYVSDTVWIDKKAYAGTGKALFIVSWDKKGKPEWFARFAYTGNATLDVLETAPDGTILLGGMLQGTIEADGHRLDNPSTKRAYTIILSPEGKLRASSVSTGKRAHRLVSAAFDTAGNQYLLFSVSGAFAYNNTKNVTDNTPGLVVQQNAPDGTPLWVKHIYGEEYLEGVKVTADDEGLFLTGSFNKTIHIADTTLTTAAQLAVVVARFGTNGSVQWVKTVQSPSKCRAMDALSTRMGNLIVTGYFREQYHVDETVTYTDHPGSSLYLLQFNKAGEPIWHDEPGSSAVHFSKAFTLSEEGNIVVAGGFKNELQIDNSTLTSAGQGDILVAKYFNCNQLQLQITGNDPICPGGERVLSATGGYAAYCWNGVEWGGRQLVVTTPGTCYVTAYDEKGCMATDTVEVLSAEIPGLWLGNDTTLYPGQGLVYDFGEAFAHYEWEDGHTGAQRTIGYISGSQPVTYGLTAETAEGCQATDSVTVSFKETGQSSGGDATNQWLVISASPNPADDHFSWWLNTDETAALTVGLADNKGRLVYQEKIDNYLPGERYDIDVSGLPPGNYMLTLKLLLPGEDVVLTEKIVVR